MFFLSSLACPGSLSFSSWLEQELKLNLAKLMSVLFIFSELILCR